MRNVHELLQKVSQYTRSLLAKTSLTHVVLFAVCVLVLGTAVKINSALFGEQARAITTIPRSLRFNSADSTYLTLLNGSTSSRDMWTMSLWVKRGTLSTIQTLASADSVATTDDRIYFDASDRLAIDINNTVRLVSTQVFRDPSSWYHIVVVFDAANGTAANRLRVYVNNIEITTWTTDTRSAIATATAKFSHNTTQVYGRTDAGATQYFNGYLADIYFVTAQTLTPSSFGETDTTTGAWQPIAYAGACNTNGYHLTFADNSNTTSATLGNDTCNNNDFTPTNFSVAAGAGNDSLTDTPTANYATGNPLQSGGGTFSNGNLDNTGTSYSTFFMDTGKWYWESTANAAGVSGGVVTASGTTSTTAIANGITRGFRFDADTGLLESTTDGSSFSTVASGLTGGRFAYVTGGANTYNFGQRAFAYTQPSGYSALNSNNLAQPTISKPSNYFTASTYTGTGLSQTIGSAAFLPGLVWVKDRTAANTHGIYDALRGGSSVFGFLSTNATSAVDAREGTLTAFGANGFTIGSDSNFNTNTNNYVSWNWKESSTSGFDIVSYTGNGANRTIAHSLGDTPDFMIVKRTDAASDWIMYHQGLVSPGTQYLKLNNQAALVTTDATMWNSTTPTSGVFSLGTNSAVNANAGTYVAYLFAEKSGYSKFGTYTGNASADGPFVYTGFKPRYILLGPASGATNQWLVYDTVRQTYNPTGKILSPDFTDAEADLSLRYLDVLSNGFKIRTSASGVNPSGGTVIYAAFAEYPFKEQHMPNGYSIPSSTRFNGTNAYLSKTFGSNGDLYKYTFSTWVKRVEEGDSHGLFGAGNSPGGGQFDALTFQSADTVRVTNGHTSNNYDRTTTFNLFRDPSRWHHIVLAVDRTQTFNHSLYIDGVLQTAATAGLSDLLAANTPSTYTNVAGLEHRIGDVPKVGPDMLDGYMSNIHFIDGQALTASDFGAFDSNGLWKPIAYAGNYISSSAQYLASILPNGFQLGSTAISNTLSDAYVAWNWKQSATAGFDIISYTGNGANRTISHSLSDTPDFMIVKRTDTAGSNWAVWHQGLSNTTTKYLYLNTTGSEGTDVTMWNSTAPTSAVFSLGTNAAVNTNTGTYIAYLWAEKSGFSKFGSYAGNNSADGPFVYTGFQPRYVLIKNYQNGTSWKIYDSARGTYNPRLHRFGADTTAAELSSAGSEIDFLSNGFKLRTAGDGTINNNNLIYAAFAEYPFKEQHMPNGYSVASSTRFDATNHYLDKTWGTSQTDARKMTISFWAKPTSFPSYSTVFSQNSGNQEVIRFETGQLFFRFNNQDFRPNAYYRDPSAWTHFVIKVDTTQAASADRVKLYINGQENTSWSTYATVALNTVSTAALKNGQQDFIGHTSSNASEYYRGYLADFYAIDGQALTPTSFGAFDSNNIWHPISYTGSYGNNGFKLDFANASDPGNDVSGNNNDFTANNIATTDNVIDTPTNNFAVANSVNNFGTTLSQGNLLVTAGAGNLVRGTLGVSTGKYYWEATATSITGTYWTMGLCDEKNTVHTLPYDLRTTGCYGNMQAYYKTINGGALTAFDANGYDGATHTHMIAVDLDNDKIWFGLDGVWYDAGNPATNSNGYTISASQDGRTFMPVFGSGSASTLNFGQGGQSGLTYDSASGGYFKYTPPTGFKALSTANMPATTAALVKGKNWFDAVTYTGTGVTQSISSLNFTPALVWIKDRTTANVHGVFDSIRSAVNVMPYLASNTTAAQIAISDGLSAFLSNGFSLGANSLFNTTNNSYISWMWKEDATSGFDIVSYTGTGANATVSHSLGATPEFMMIKNYGATGAWTVWHKDLTTPTTQYMVLNTTALPATDATMWNSTIPTTTNFSLGTNAAVNTASNTYIAYLFKSVSGFSKIGSYTGNASADGAFVYTGFKPKFVMVKRMTGATGSWVMWDSSRNQYNVVDGQIIAEANTAQTTVTATDFVANGFKLRATTANFNAAATYVYVAFAELPFKYSSGIGSTIFSVPASMIFMEF